MFANSLSAKNIMSRFEDTIVRANKPSEIEVFLALCPKLPRYTYIRQFIVFSKENLEDVLIQRKIDDIGMELVNENVPAFHLWRIYGYENKKVEGFVVIIPSDQPNIYRLTSISRGKFWNYIVRRLVFSLYPLAMPVFFKQNEIQDALLLYEKSISESFRLRISEATLKSYRDGGKSTKRRIFDTHRYWTRQSITEVFDLASERSAWFKGLKFIVDVKKKQSNGFIRILDGRIYKEGEVHTSSYIAGNIISLLKPLEEFASERLMFLDNRGIRQRNYVPGPPLSINYKQDFFKDKEEFNRFKKVIDNYKNSTKAIYHSNPYFHAGVADFLDGSSFEIWVLAANRIVIVPLAKASEQALERLISHIFFEYREGEISELKAQ